MTQSLFNVMFICRHNAARSLMAEGLLRKWGGKRFRVFSAGPEPMTWPDQVAMERLKKVKADTSVLHPKHWDAFMGEGTLAMDFVFFVCERTWEMPRPSFLGSPMIAYWPFPDPLSIMGSPAERQSMINLVFGMIERRVKLLCALPDHRLMRLTDRDLSTLALNDVPPVREAKQKHQAGEAKADAT
jgi:arsenate reductase (thioredoxin)